MINETIRVSLAFARAADHVIETAGYTVHTKLYEVPEFPSPPVTADELETSTQAFTAALAEMANGGKLATARKNVARISLVDQLRKLAYYVQIQCANDMTLLLASGFDPVSVNRTRVPLPKPNVLRIENGMTGQTILAAEPNPNARSWQAESALVGEDGVPGAWVGAAPATDSRRIVINNLIPGRVFAFRLRAIGGSTGFSDWSNPITYRAA